MGIGLGLGLAKDLFGKAFDNLSRLDSIKASRDYLKTNIDKDIANGVRGAKGHLKRYDSNMKILNESRDGLSDSGMVKLKKEQGIAANAMHELANERGEGVGYMKAGMKNYLDADGKWGVRALRGGALLGGTAAASVAVGTAGRYAMGGSLNRNSNGKKDLVGIPFV